MYLFIFLSELQDFFGLSCLRPRLSSSDFTMCGLGNTKSEKGKKGGGGGEIARKIDGTDSVLTLTVLN